MRMLQTILAAATIGFSFSSAYAGESRLGIQSGIGSLDFDDTDGDPHFYVGMGFGKARTRLSYASQRYTDAYKVFAGLNLNQYLGAELSFLSIRSPNGGANIGVVQITGNRLLAAGVATLPLAESFEIGAKVGIANYKTQASSATTNNSSDAHYDWVYGVLMNFNFTKRFSVRTEYDGVGVNGAAFDVITVNGLIKF